MQKGKTEEHLPDISDSIKRFRSIMNRFKKTIHDQMETYNDNEDIQKMDRLNGVIHRIKQFGRFIIMILTNIEHPDTISVNEYFARNSLDLKSLTDEENNACKHYVNIDLFTYPFDLNIGHIESLRVNNNNRIK